MSWPRAQRLVVRLLGALGSLGARFGPVDSLGYKLWWFGPRLVALIVVGGPRALWYRLQWKLLATEGRYRLWRRRRLGQRRGARSGGVPAARQGCKGGSVLVFATGASGQALQRSLASLTRESLGAWRIIVHTGLATATAQCADGELEAGCGQVVQARSWTAVLEKLRGDCVAFVPAGDVVALRALTLCEQALREDPSIAFAYTDEDTVSVGGKHSAPVFKPGWDSLLLRSQDTVGGALGVRRSCLPAHVGGHPPGSPAWQHRLLQDIVAAGGFGAHVPEVLYHRSPRNAAASRAYNEAARRAALRAPLQALRAAPLVSIIIPTRERWELVKQCLDSIRTLTTYPNYEILIVDNGSRHRSTLQYLAAQREPVRVLRYNKPFNFSAINNVAAAHARGALLLFLNNDTQVLSAQWLEAMVEQALDPAVGAVGARLLFPDGTIQHAGVVLGIGPVAAHVFSGQRHGALGLDQCTREVTCVTAAAMMMRRQVFAEIGGFDERFRVAYNDVDLCLRLRSAGYRIIYTPRAELLHFESLSRGARHPRSDEALAVERWGETIAAGDLFYNSNLSRVVGDWSVGFPEDDLVLRVNDALGYGPSCVDG